MSNNSFINELSKLKNNLDKLINLHNNPFDTSSFSGNRVIQQIQDLQKQLNKATCLGGTAPEETPSSSHTESTSSSNLPRSISASVGKGGTNNEADVRAVQGWLNHHGARIGVDGQYGNGTLREINRFQRRAGLTADGLISPGKNTWKALIGERPVGERTSAVASIIQGGESAVNGYNAYNLGSNGNTITAGNQRLELVSMTLGEVMAKQRRKEIFAVGKYQMIPTTLQEGVENLGLSESLKFDRTTQDLLFSGWLMKNKRPAIHAYITGTGPQKEAQVAGAMEWASIACPPGTKGHLGHDVSNKSYYDGHGGNVAHITVDEFLYALNEAKASYERNIAAGKNPEEAYRDAVTGVESTANSSGGSSNSSDDNTGSTTTSDNTNGDGTTNGTLSGSVGKGGTNNEADVRRVQELLNKKGATLGVDGKIGANTISTIRAFQSANSIPPDGLISPGRNTWKKLTGNGNNITSSTDNNNDAPTPPQPTGSYSYHNHPNWQKVRLEYQPGSRTAHKLNPTAERLLRSVTAEAGLDYVLVTSTKRTFTDQAYITLTQVSRNEAFKWYGYAASDQARYYRHKKELADGRNPEEVYREYGEYIRRFAGEKASNHIPGYAIDVSMSGLSTFNAGAKRLVPIKGSGVRTVFPEPGRTHIEFTFVVV